MTATPMLWLASFVALGALVAALLFRSAWPLWVRSAVVLALFGVFQLAWAVSERMAGFPSESTLPERFVMLASVIEEPNAERGEAGAIYVWLNALEDGRPAAQPRAYRLPYGKDLHTRLDEAMKKIRQGVAQVGSTEPQRANSGLPWLRPTGDKPPPPIRIGDLPSPQLPEK